MNNDTKIILIILFALIFLDLYKLEKKNEKIEDLKLSIDELYERTDGTREDIEDLYNKIEDII